MDKFLLKVGPSHTNSLNLQEHNLSGKRNRDDINLEELPSDPSLRQPISTYHVNHQESIRRYYLQNGPCQPHLDNFPQSVIGHKARRFNKNWYNEFKGWLEYSASKDAAYCLYCYIFPQKGCEPTFVTRGFKYWKDKTILEKHVGNHMSAHNVSRKMCEALMNQKHSIQIAFARQEETQSIEYHGRLCASIDCIRYLLRQGLPFRGHDETKESKNRGNFLELLEFLASHNNDINAVVLRNAPNNCQLTSPKIQKEIVSAIASETSEAIVNDIGDDCFSILVDESRDGASNMKGEFRGLKALIMRENNCAFYVHCFAHQLQLVLVAVAEGHFEIADLFSLINTILNVVGGSCKRRDSLRALEVERVARELGCSELESGRGLNQALELKRAGETRWSSHYGTILNFIRMFASIVDVLEIITVDGADGSQRGMANTLLIRILTYNFIFLMHLMKNILAKTHEMSQALQKKDQDIVNAMNFVKLSKHLLCKLRNDDIEWQSFMSEVSSFCIKHAIEVPNMNEKFVQPGRSRRRSHEITTNHHFRVEIFNTVLDWLLNELNDRFDEVNTELLLCVSCLDPNDNFSCYDKKKLLRLAEFYPYDFTPIELQLLDGQLDTYICDMRTLSADTLSQVRGISGLLQMLVDTKKDKHFLLVFRLLKLACLLPVATATVERMFSAMKIVKSRLRNRMSDDWMNDCLIAYIEKDVADTITNDKIISRFQNMCTRKMIC